MSVNTVAKTTATESKSKKEAWIESRLTKIRQWIAHPIPSFKDSDWTDPYPALIECKATSRQQQQQQVEGHILIGNKYHAANVSHLVEMGVTAVLNCASGGISRLPVEELKANSIRYAFTNVRQDHWDYPILLDKSSSNSNNNQKSATTTTKSSGSEVYCSHHLYTAKALYADTIRQASVAATSSADDKNTLSSPPKVLFFCVAGQNRSAALAVAVLMLYGYPLDDILQSCFKSRPFILENVGFQRQLVELEWMLQHTHTERTTRDGVYTFANRPPPSSILLRQPSSMDGKVEVELFIPGLYTMDVKIPVECTIPQLKECLVQHANKDLLAAEGSVIASSWIVLAMFGYDDMYDVPLEVEAMDRTIQLERIRHMFGLKVFMPNTPFSANSIPEEQEEVEHGRQEAVVRWNDKCRFALVIFSVYKRNKPTKKDGSCDPDVEETALQDQEQELQVPWTFVHEERPSAPATLLNNTLMSTYLRAWDFVTGQAYCSQQPIVFSFSHDPRDKRQFMKISTSAHEAQQFHAPGEGGILGMGANAIVHRVQLKPTSSLPNSSSSLLLNAAHTMSGIMSGNGSSGGVSASSSRNSLLLDHSGVSDEETDAEDWDAAVKRPFSLEKMLAALQNSSEAGLAKRLRFANSLNSDGRVLFFYGLGVALSANAENTQEYKFEATLLARYEEEFSTYTMKRFMIDYTTQPTSRLIEDEEERHRLQEMQSNFTIISVKVLLVSLLNAFRDLTLMGVQAFDFNHMNNVLVSQDHSTVHLIDIDGNSKGSIQFPSEYIQGRRSSSAAAASSTPSKQQQQQLRPHKPSLDVDLNTLLPTLVLQLMLGKGRGPSFVSNKRSEIWRAPPEKAKQMIRDIIRENFFPRTRIDEETDDGQTKEVQHGKDVAAMEPTSASSTGQTTRGRSASLSSSAPSLSSPEAVEKHVTKIAEWFYAVLKKSNPWDNWTNDIYDAMRCIDHLPIT